MRWSQQGVLMVGQSGGPTAVINATLAGVLQEAARHDAIRDVLGMVHGIEGALKGEIVRLPALGPEDLDRLARTPAAALGSCRYKVKPEDHQRILSILDQLNVRYFLYIGGNDSMDTCHRIAQLAMEQGYELSVVGLPKTIDNDLAVTDHAPGYGSAARFIAAATMDTGFDLEAMDTFDDVSILEVMGRNAGWLTAASALGKRRPEDPPHLVLVPEHPFNEAKFLQWVHETHRNLGHVFVAVSEGIRDEQGRLIASYTGEMKQDRFGHQLVTLSPGAGYYLAQLISRELGLQARVNRPGTMQRSAGLLASTTDRQEAFQVGVEGVRLAVKGATDIMVAIERVSSQPYISRLSQVPLEQVANAEKRMPADFVKENGSGVDPSFVEYAMPLIGEPLPDYVRLSWVRVSVTER